MPALSDIELHVEAFKPRIQGKRFEQIRLANPFLLRSFDPPVENAFRKPVVGSRRLGRRIVIELDEILHEGRFSPVALSRR